MIELRHPDRHTPQFAYTERDVAYLERTGWKRETPPEPKRAALLSAPVKNKGGRPRKVRDEHHDVR